MNSARPSTIGEILDRAIATYVRRFLPLFVILALVMVPIAVVESLFTPGLTHLVEMLTQLGRVPPGHPAESQRILQEFQRGSGTAAPVFLMYVAQGLLIPLADTALVIFAAAALDGVPVTIGSAYRAGVARWLPQIAVGVAFLAMLGVAFVAFFVATVLAALAIAGLFALSHVIGIVLGIVIGIVAFAAFVVVVAIANVAWLMAMVSIAVEEPNPARAIGRSLRRTFDRLMFKRTIALGFAILAIGLFGSLAFVSFSAALAFVTHSDAVSALVSASGGVAIGGVSTLMVLVYVRDLRLRREGSDLLLLATGEPAPQA